MHNTIYSLYQFSSALLYLSFWELPSYILITSLFAKFPQPTFFLLSPLKFWFETLLGPSPKSFNLFFHFPTCFYCTTIISLRGLCLQKPEQLLSHQSPLLSRALCSWALREFCCSSTLNFSRSYDSSISSWSFIYNNSYCLQRDWSFTFLILSSPLYDLFIIFQASLAELAKLSSQSWQNQQFNTLMDKEESFLVFLVGLLANCPL